MKVRKLVKIAKATRSVLVLTVMFLAIGIPRLVASIVLDVLTYEGPEFIQRIIRRHEDQKDK
jgi:hypothetical protein